jgi:UDP-N-acetylmuramate dehydrogenase
VQIQKQFPLSKVTTLQIGGPAKEFVVIKTEEELIEAIQYAQKLHLGFLIIGGGSNLLVADEGIDKLIIKNEISGIKKLGNNLVVKSGTILQDLVNFAVDNGLAGIEKMAGIPGTVGGAVYGNAGAYGQTISDHLIEVKYLDSSVLPMKLRIYSKSECQFDYRYSNFKKSLFPILEITFSLTPTDSQELKKVADETLSKRFPKYPPGIKCPGSFFKNILAKTLSEELLKNIPSEKIPYGKVSVGYLLDEVGAKGDQLGEIEIAPYHANLFINKGGGKASDFYKLASKYQKKVYEKFGITIEPEVQLINLPKL